MTDFAKAKATGTKSIDDMRFRIRSIRAHAMSKRVSEDVDDRTKHTPIVLIGTHFDEIKMKEKDGVDWVQHVNNVLLREFGTVMIISDNDMKAKWRKGSSLCYWPVDSTDENDPNIKKLRILLFKAIVNDPLDYINDPIPISWLKVMDELVRMSDNEPLLQLYSTNKEQLSVFVLIHKFHALDDTAGDTEAYIKRAIALMQYGHRIGAFVYFYNIPGLEGFCILNPQWIIDTMAYIIRDVKLHRFRRDYSAMEVNGGASWASLVTKGVLDLALLRRLWMGEEHCVDFLANLLVNLGLFGVLQVKEGNIDQRFLVPSMITVPFDVEHFAGIFILKHLGLESLKGGCGNKVQFEDGFMPIGYCNRVIAILVTVWKRSYIEADPFMLPNGCLLRMGTCPYALILDTRTNSIVIISHSKDASVLIMPHIIDAMTDVNDHIYNGLLHFNYEEGELMECIGDNVLPPVGDNKTMDDSKLVAYRDVTHAPLPNLDLANGLDGDDHMRDINIDIFTEIFTDVNISKAKAEFHRC